MAMRPQDKAAPRRLTGGRRRKKEFEFDKQKCLDEIFDKFATSSKGLHRILTENTDLPSVSQFWRWLRRDDAAEDPVGYSNQYRLAKRLQAEFLESELLDIADEDPGHAPNGFTDGSRVQHNKLRIDTRKWVMARLYSEKYGDRTTLAGDKENPLMPSTDLSRLSDEELETFISLRKKIESNT